LCSRAACGRRVRFFGVRNLVPCSACRRHLKTSESSCPFCGARRLAIGAGIVALASLGVGWVSDGGASSSVTSNSPDASSTTPTNDAADGGAPPREHYNVQPVYGTPVPPSERAGCSIASSSITSRAVTMHETPKK
jgi:hypothetical protein